VESEVTVLKASIIGIIGFLLGAGTMQAISWTKTVPAPRQVTPAATLGMPSIDELHAKAHAQDLPDQTVKEPY
jgi:hypothetical protein